MSDFFKNSSKSGDNELFVPSRVSNKPVDPSNSIPLAPAEAPQVPIYIKVDLKQILRMVLEA